MSTEPASKSNWKLTKYGVAMICAGVALYGLGIVLAVQLSSKIVFFGKTSNFLMIAGMALVGWDVYQNYFGERAK